LKKPEIEKKKASPNEIDWDNDPRFKALLAPLQANWKRKEDRQKDLNRLASTLNGADPIANAYQFIYYLYSNYNETYGDYEFLVLLASRGFDVSSYKLSIYKNWKAAAEKEKQDRSLSSHYNADTGESEIKKTNLDDIWPFPEFWRGSRYESDSIDATMFRIVDYFQISGFDGYWNELKEDLSLAVADSSEGQHAMAQYLFNMCRTESGLLLLHDRMAIIIELLIKGKDPKVKYFWEYRSLNREGMYHYNCPYAAAGLMFTIIKMGFSKKYNTLIEACEKYLVASQASNGGWKAVTLHDSESVDATAVCIHALALRDREKYKDALVLAAEFLMSKQDDWWLWYEEGNPYVSYPYLSVLVLDALEFAKGNYDQLTFTKVPLKASESNKNEIEKYIINLNMGDTNNFKGGQFGAVGSQAKAEHNTFNQANYNLPENLDYGQLSSELEALKNTMKDKAETADDYLALAEVINAKQAASDKDGNKVVQKLLGAGKWAFETAKEIGVGVVVELINKQIKG
jgi:hypothetical protein